MSTVKVNELSTYSGTDISIETGKTIAGTASQFKMTGGSSGQFVKTDGSGGLSFDTVAVTGFSDMKFKTASETYTVPTGITKIVVDIMSGGGGGGGGAGPYWSSGGSAGANAIKTLTVSVGQTYTLVVGTGGAGGTPGATGTSGGTSSFVNASGTTVNLQCTGGGGGSYNGASLAGGVATGGDLNIDGARGNSTAAGGQSAWVAGSTRWGFPSGQIDITLSGAQDGVGYGAGGCAAYAVTNGEGADGRPGLCVITEYK